MLFSVSVSEAKYPNAIEWHHDSPALALSPLSRHGYCPPWPHPSREAPIPLPRAPLCRSHFPPGLELSRAIARGEGADHRHGDACQWDARHRTRLAREYEHRHDRTQKKEPDLYQVNHAVLQAVNPEHMTVEMCRSEELDRRWGLTSERDEMWSYVAKKSQPRWLWHAIDHHTGKVLAYVFGRRQDEVFLRLQQLLEPFGITKFYTDGWGAYERHLDPEQHQVGKEHTQKIESKYVNLRTRIKRLVRRTLCFSKTERMHDLVIGLFINRYEFGRLI